MTPITFRANTNMAVQTHTRPLRSMTETDHRGRISLCVIARDEEALLDGCLASARDAVDEMIVVDTGSTDGTVAVARAAGARVEPFLWCDDFAAARNACIGYAQNDWILILDADERLGPEAAQRVVASVRGTPDFVCGMLRVHDASHANAAHADVLSGKERLGEPMFVPRLLRRTDDLAFEGIVHESVRAWLVRHDNRVRDIRANIVHLGAVPGTRVTRGKRERNVRLLEMRRKLEPTDFTVHGYLAHEHIGAGDFLAAWRVIEEGWQLFLGDSPKELRSVLRLTAARAMLQFKQADAAGALATARATEAYEGRQPDLSFCRGRAHESLALAAAGHARARHLDEALAAYRDALEQRTVPVAQRYVAGSSGWAAAARLGTVHLLRGEPQEALAQFEYAAAEHPQGPEGCMGRCEALAVLGDVDLAQAVWDEAIDDHEELPDSWLVGALIADARGDCQTFERLLEQARKRSPSGYAEPHRNGLHGELHCALLAYLGQPAPGSGVIGRAAAVMAGVPSSLGANAPAGAALSTPDRSNLSRFVRNMIVYGKATQVDKLLSDHGQEALPGVVDLVETVVRGLGMTVEEK